MFMLTITEASGLLSSSIFWLLMSANPNEPGSPSIPARQTITNLFIMLFGEFVITDGAIAYASHKFRGRYIVDLAVEWEETRAKRKGLV